MSESTCPFILTKGARKGQVCGVKSKSDSIKYCRHHVRNIGVQQELIKNGVDIDTTIKTTTAATGPGLKPINNDIYGAPIIKQNITTQSVKEDKENAFISSFTRNLDTKLSDETIEIDMDRVYDNFDENINNEEEEVVATSSSRDDEVIRLQKEIIALREQKAASERRIQGMFTIKQAIFVGVKAVAEIAEHSSDKLSGYTNDVLTSNEINTILDELSSDLEIITGFSDQPAYIRLALTLSTIGACTLVRNNSGYLVQTPSNIPCPPPADSFNNPIPEQEGDFTPLYKE